MKRCTILSVILLCFFTLTVRSQGKKDTVISLKEISIRTAKTTGTDAVLLDEMKTTNNVVTGISAEQISKGQDKDAAEIIKRIQGVALNDDRFIVVRGLNERYNTTWLNNAPLPSTEPDKSAFSFDAIPSMFIDQVMIYKTPSADLPGNFAGGTTRIVTKMAPLGSSLTLTLNGFYRDGTTLEQMQFTKGSKTDFLGYDKEFREVPDGLPAYLSKSSIKTSELFNNTWVLHNETSLPDFRFNAVYSKGVKRRNTQFGVVAGINYDASATRYLMHRQEYESGALSMENNDTEYTKYAKVAAIADFKLLLGNNNKFEFMNLFNQAGRTQSTISQGTDEGLKSRGYVFGYESKTLYSSQLSYQHTFPGDAEYNATAGLSYNQRADPDLRRIIYGYSNDTFFRTATPPGSGQLNIGEGASRFFAVLNERIYSLNQQLKQPLKVAGYSFTLTAGAYTEYKDRDFSSRLFGYVLPVTDHRRPFSALPVDSIFSPRYIEYADTVNGKVVPAGFKILEATNPSNSYRGTNLLYAPYACFRLPVAAKLSLEAGLRYEYNMQSLHTIVGVDTINIDLKTKFALPSANLRYDISQGDVMRASYGRTVNRPEFREWAPFLYYDFEFMALTHGSLYPSPDHPHGYILQTAVIDNYDLSYDRYFTKNDFFHVGAFYKHFTNPIEQIVESRLHMHGISKEITFLNLHQAMCAGMEFESRKNLGFLAPGKGVMLSKLSMAANLTLIRGEAMSTNDTFGVKRALQGQAPYLLNFGLFYDAVKLHAALTYNVIGPRIFLAAGNDGPGTPMGVSIGELPKNEIDLSFKMALTRRLTASAGIKDLLNQPVALVADNNRDGRFNLSKGDKEFLRYRKGSYYSFGIALKL